MVKDINLQCEEHKYFSPYAGSVVVCVDTKGLESGQNDEDGCPTVVQREW